MKEKFLKILEVIASVLTILGFLLGLLGFGLHSEATQFFMQSSPVEVILSAGVIAIAIIAIMKK